MSRGPCCCDLCKYCVRRDTPSFELWELISVGILSIGMRRHPVDGPGNRLESRDPHMRRSHDPFRQVCLLAYGRLTAVADNDTPDSVIEQGSITQQVFPLIPERFLSETPEPPLTTPPPLAVQ
jgi:hypothetical protein